jgi:hypothetical protein
VRAYLRELRAAVARLAGLLEADEVVLTAGGSTYFDAVADKLTALPSGAGSSSASRTRAWCSTSGIRTFFELAEQTQRCPIPRRVAHFCVCSREQVSGPV